jgi:hypothetical protein
VIDVKSTEVETAELVASRIRRALEHVPASRLMINPDCGLRHLPPDIARRKLHAMVAGTDIVRAELRAGLFRTGRVLFRLRKGSQRGVSPRPPDQRQGKTGAIVRH